MPRSCGGSAGVAVRPERVVADASRKAERGEISVAAEVFR